MPNWCENKATIRHPDHDVMKSLVLHYNSENICQKLIPIPEDIKSGDNVVEWCRNAWGTKWDIGAGDYGVETECYPVTPTDEQFVVLAERYRGFPSDLDKVYEMQWKFLSAWAPPEGLYQKLKEMGCYVEAYFYEPGLCFCGTWIDGDVEDYRIEEGNFSADLISNFPELLQV